MAQGGGGAMSGMGDGPTPLPRPEARPQPAIKTDMMRPSQYKREMCMTTAERHRAYSDKRELDRLYAGHRPYKAFTVIPHRVVFQKFGRCDTQEQQVIFRNDDCIPHLLRVMPSMSPYISVTLVSAQGGKLAPGMFVAYRVTFRPEEQCDYYYELQCTSDQVTFSVPIMAIGPRAILDFPDRIVFQNHPVHAETSKLLSVKNVGQKAAKFSLNVASPFSVEPRCGTLPAGAVAQIAIHFLPTAVGQHCEHALLTYDNGEKVVLEIHGTGVEVDVGLSNYTIRMDTTFIGLTSRKTFRLYNKSATPATFVWRRQETAERPRAHSSSAPAGERSEPTDPSLMASLTAGARVQLPPSALRDTAETGEEEAFEHPIFSIEPLRGEVWPDSAVDVTAIFQPDSEGETDCIAFCQVTGRASRLPLRISGRGRGADVQLSLDSLDIGAVFKNSVFNYEVVAVNRGDIPATLQPLPASSAWSRHISFRPAEMQLHPKDHRTLVLTLDAQILGQLDERFSVQVSGASRPLSLHLRGRVIPPTLEFDSALLDFGVAPFGFRKVLRCRLKNTSLVPVEFSLSVPDDGRDPAIRQEKLAAHLYQVVKKGLSCSPQEFTLKPSRGVLQPQSSVSIKVELVANSARRIASRLRVDIDGVKEALYSIPVSAECVAADVQLRAPDVLLGRHFKGRSADGAVTLVNRSPVAARFFLLPQESMEFPGVTYRCEEPTGVIEPHATATVPFTVRLEALGSLVMPIRLVVFGRAEPLQVLVRVVSQGPVIDIQPPSLDWGVVPVLTPHHKTVTISNQAPVPANVTATMRSGSYWTIDPCEATVGPEQTLPLRLTAVLDDPLRFFDVLVISVQDSGTWEIPVAAQGRGSSILFEPPLQSFVDLGPVFCKSPMTKVFSATNKGRRYHQLVWSNDGVVEQSAATSLANLTARGSGVKLGKRLPGQVPVFRVSPRRVDMYPGETQAFTLEAYCESVGWRREELSCTAMIGSSSGKTVLKRLVVAAEFIRPVIEFSRREIKFERKRIPGMQFTEQMAESLTLTNNSPLALTTHVRTQYPFLLRNLRGALSAESDYELGVHRAVTLEVLFDPDYETGLTSRYIRDKLIITYEEHPHCDEVALVGMVSFPNLVVSDKAVEFGCILNDMESFRKIKITNSSKVPVQYHWYFVDGDTALDWLPEEDADVVAAAELAAEAALADTPQCADNVLQETRVDRLITQKVDKFLVECPVATKEERLQSLRQRRQSRYLTPPPPVDRTTAAEKMETQWKTQAAVNEILDIYPLRGKLQPGDNTSVVFKFYGHGSVRFRAGAVCAVLGGPQYPVTVSGQASSIRYRMEQHHVECGGHLYCQFLESSTTLHNTGQVEFPWRLSYEPEEGRLQVAPTEGVLQAGAAQRIAIHFLPMMPEYFERRIELAVAHFPPEVITVTGHGAYPAVMLDLPLRYEDISEMVFLEAVQNISAVMEDERCGGGGGGGLSPQSSDSSEQVLAIKNQAGSANPDRADLPATILFEQGQQPQLLPMAALQPADRLPAPPDLSEPPASSGAQEVISGEAAPADPPTPPTEQTYTEQPTAAGPLSSVSGYTQSLPPAPLPPADPPPLTEPADEAEHEPEELQDEEEPAATDEHEQEPALTESPLGSTWSVVSHTDSALVDAALIDLEVERLMTVNFIRSHPTTASFLHGGGSSRRDAVSMDLLKYHLDFGLVLLGSDLHRAVTVTNISQLPVNLTLITSILPTDVDSDLRVHLEDDINALQPGSSTYIHMRLRPSSLQQPVETVQKMIYLEVKFGLFIPILLKATVTAPIAELDEGELGFGTVYVGQCKVCQLKVHNNGILPAVWSLLARPPDRPAALPFSSGERPRRKAAAAAAPPVFTFEPSAGQLLPDQWAVVNVIFAPAKSKAYVMEAALSVQGSSQTWLKRMSGEGLDSSLDFSSLELAFEPIVPYNEAGRMEVTIFNRHPVPLEIFSLEFDRQYLEEEHVLRTLTAYDEFEQVVLPRRRPGEPLASEVRGYYSELVHRAALPGRPPDDINAAAASSHVSLDLPTAGVPVGKSRSQILRTPDLHSAGVRGGPSMLPLPAVQPALQPTLQSAGGGLLPGMALTAAASSTPLPLPAISVSPTPSQLQQAAGSDGAAHWPGWAGVLDQPAMWTLPGQEQFIREYLDLCMSGASRALRDPVALAVQNCINSDQPANYHLNLSRKAPAFVIMNAPYTEPYLLAVLLAERYGVSVVTVDQLVWESLLTPSSAAAHRARDFLLDSGKQGGRAPPAAKQPANSKRGPSTVAGASRGGGPGKRRSETDSSLAPDLRDTVKPRPLPPAMLGELIAVRLTEPDVSGGVVFWDVHSCQFSSCVTHTVTALLLGIGKRKHAYFLTMNKSAAQHIDFVRQQKATDDGGESRPVYTPPPESALLACDEVEYEALPERDRTRLCLLMRRTRQKRARERRDEVRKLQEQLRQEHEKKSRKGKSSGVHKQLSHHSKISAPDQPDSRKGSVRKPSAMSRVSLRQPRSDVSIEPHDRKKRGLPKKKGDEDVVLDERQIEEEKQITAQFKAFHDTLTALVCLLDIVDRDRLVPEGMPAEDALKFGATQHKRSSKGKGQRTGKNSTLSKRATTVDEFRVPTDLGVTHVLLNGSLECRACYQLLVESGALPSPGRVRQDMGQGSEGPPLAPCRTFSVLKRPAARSLPEMADPVFTFRLDEAEKAALAEAAAAEKEEKAQRITPEKSPPPKRRGQRRLKGKRRSDVTLAGDQRAAGSMGGECDTDLATAIRQALHRDDPVVSAHRWVVPAEGELSLVVQFEVNRPGRYQARLQLETAATRRRYTLECSGSCVLPLINRKIKTLYAKVPMRADDYGAEHGVAFIRGTRTLAFGPLPVVKPGPKLQARTHTSAPLVAPPPVPHGHQAEVTMENISPLPVEISFYLFNESFKVPPFQLWPLSLSLAPGEKDYLQVMALPPAPQNFEDMLIGCVKDNPDPWITKLTCIGARPEVHVDKKQLTFDRVLLLRKEARRLVLTNRSLIPLQFRVTDTEQLGEGFVFRPREGTLMPLGISELEVEFSPIRPCLYHNKKIKLEITEHFEEPAADEAAATGASGSDNSVTNSSPRSPRTTLGILQSETITVSAEGFDVAVDLMFPKGLVTGVDFGTIKVKEESKQTFTIKNKGKYEIMFKAWLEDPEPVPKGAKSLTHGFHLSPDRGILHPHERPLNIQMWFSTETETWVKKAQMLRVQILDFHKKEEGEVIALIPVCVSVRALFCKYSVTPNHELHLGHFPVAVRKTGFFVIKNDGKFDFSYHIVRKNVDPTASHDSPQGKKRGRPSAAKGGSSSSKSTSQENAGPISTASVAQKLGGGQSSKGAADAKAMKLMAGIYVLQPAMGTIPVSSQVVVNVEAISGEAISDIQELVIRISDAGDGVGIPFRLLGNVTTASIRDPDGDIVSIFEEHAVVDSLKNYQPGSQLKSPPAGVYGRAENRFLVSPTLLGDAAHVSFKVHNTSMVPVDVVINVKPPGAATAPKSKSSADTTKTFDVSPCRANIAVHGFLTVTVTFTPNALQTFVNVLDIQVEEPTGIDRNKGITFEVMGEGTLPLLNVLEPSEVTRQQEPLLHFLSTRLGDSAVRTVRLRNAGLVQCMVDLLLAEGRDLFTVVPDEQTLQYAVKGQERAMISSSEFVLGTLCLPAGGEAALSVTFSPRQAGRCSGLLLLSVNYNAFQRQAVRLDGHGYSSGVLVRGLAVSQYVPPPPPPPPPKSQKEEPPPVYVIGMDMPQLQYALEFVSCYIGATYKRQFRMENCSDACRYRFEWHNSQYLTFSPAVGHLAPREIKTVTVTFVANEAINFEKTIRPAADVPPPVTKRGKAKVEPTRPEHGVSCVVTAIAYAGESPEQQLQQLQQLGASSWDERSRSMQLVVAETADGCARSEEAGHHSSEAVTRLLPESEPAFEELPPSPALRLDVTAVLQTDLARVRFSGGPVSFNDTFMFQARTEEVTLENVGLAEVRYSWSVEYVPPTARPVSAETQVYSGELDSQTSVAGSGRSDSGASFLHLMSRRLSELADYVPFTIEPSAGSVPPGQTATFTVRFAPLDILEYCATFKCSMPYLSEEAPPPTVSVHGCGVLPVCHFDLDDTGCRENGDDLTPPTDCDLRVVTIDAVGVNRKVTRTFRIINPTESSWHYTFTECERDDGPRDAWFNCANAAGMVNSGQRARVTFEFFPRAEGTFESRWQLFIREHQLTVDLVLRGRAREPVVYATEPVLRLPAVLTGTTSHGQLTLVNEEATSLRYQLDLDSCYSASQALRLTVLPIEGVVPARGAATLHLQYLAVADGPAEFGLHFSVETRHAPLQVSVSTEGYTLQAEATLLEPRAKDRPLSAAGVNQLDLGLIPCRETVYRAIQVTNTGRFPFTVQLENGTESPPPRTAVTLDPAHRELVEARKRVTCKFGVCCSAKVKFPNIKILVKVVNGPCFVLLVRGSAEPPNVSYSHASLDFGPCFLHQDGMPPIVSELRVENKDKHPVSVGVEYDDVPYLKIDFKQTVIASAEKVLIPIEFVPLEVRRYVLTVNVIVNGQVHRALRVSGQGIRFQVEVANSEHKQLVLGDFRAGQRLQRSVTIVNRADAAVRCQFQLSCSSPGLQNLSSPVLRLRPAETELRPRSAAVLELQCFSKTRLPWFQEQVRLTSLGITHSLLTVEGTCQGMELRLDVPTLPFGSVAAYSKVKRNICIINDGDIGARFRWPTEPLQPEFTIWPTHGYSAPKSRVVCEVTMHPRELSSVIKKEGVTCEVENYGSLPLTLTGCCVPVTVAKEPLQFVTAVRTEDVRTIQITNKSNTGWEVVPVVSGQFWRGQEVLTVPPQSVGVCSVAYQPMVMTSPGQKHTGSVFVALPDGQALLYSLVGSSEPPLPAGRLTADIASKTGHQETVEVTNWLTEPQRFTARAEVVRSEKDKDKSDVSSVRLTGLDYLDVPALATLPFTLTVFCYKEGSFHVKLTFRNEDSGEFLYYDLGYRVAKSHDRQRVELHTVVRRAVQHSVLLERPLESPMTCQVTCNMNELILGHHGTIHFPPGQEARVSFEVLPLREGSSEAPLDVHSQEMGTYGFEVSVTARRPPLAGTVHLTCPLGQSVSRQVKYTNYSRTRAEYATQLVSAAQLWEPLDLSPAPDSTGRRGRVSGRERDDDKPKTFAELLTQLQNKGDGKEMTVDRAVYASPGWPQGVESSLDLTYEPTDVCSLERGLVLSSPNGGEYRFAVHATCTLPEPQGPLTIKAGANVVIPFKNIFPATAPYGFYVDSPYFSLSKTPDTIRAKKDIRVTVSFDPTRGPPVELSAGRPITACLTISGPTLPHGQTPAWRYYLRGLPSNDK